MSYKEKDLNNFVMKKYYYPKAFKVFTITENKISTKKHQ